MEIREALEQLDPQDDAHWTVGGEPRLDVLTSLFGKRVTRQEVIDTAPGFTRENPLLDKEDEVTVEENPEVQLAEAAQALEKAKVKLSEATAKVDAKIIAAEADQEPAHTRNMLNIQAYLARQQENKRNRVARVREANPSNVQPLAPIDAAMRRPTGFGRKRPVVPLKTGG